MAIKKHGPSTGTEDPWPESMDEVAKLAGFPEGLGTKNERLSRAQIGAASDASFHPLFGPELARNFHAV
jgi:hypothetical protein